MGRLGAGAGLEHKCLGHPHRTFISPAPTLSFFKYISCYIEKQKETHDYLLSANINEYRFQTSFQSKIFMVIWPSDQLNLTRCLGAGVGQARVKSQESADAVL